MVTICNQIHKNTDKFSYRGIKGRSKNSKINSICNLWTRIYGYFLYFLQILLFSCSSVDDDKGTVRTE